MAESDAPNVPGGTKPVGDPQAPNEPPAPQSRPENGQSGDPTAPPSILERLRAKRDEKAEDRRITLPIGRFGNMMLARYKPIPYRELRGVQQRAQRRARQGGEVGTEELTMTCNVLVRACEAILVRTDPDAEPVELQTLVEEFGDDPVRYDQRLAKALDFKTENAIEVVRFTFDNPIALQAHGVEYGNWVADAEADQDF